MEKTASPAPPKTEPTIIRETTYVTVNEPKRERDGVDTLLTLGLGAALGGFLFD